MLARARLNARRGIRALSAHCGHCGAAFGGPPAAAQTCPACARVSYRNPTPVAVALVRLHESGGLGGLLGVRRADNGGLALPGGYVDFGETWDAALRREVREETGLELSSEAGFKPLHVASSSGGGQLLVFGEYLGAPVSLRGAEADREEVTEVVSLSADDIADLCWETHREAARLWVGGGPGGPGGPGGAGAGKST